VLHPLQVALRVLEDQFGVDDCGVPEAGEDGASDLLVVVVEVHEDGADDVVEGRLGQLDVPAGEEQVYCSCDLQPDRVLGVVQSLQ
jgi:hypothetical protein